MREESRRARTCEDATTPGNGTTTWHVRRRGQCVAHFGGKVAQMCENCTTQTSEAKGNRTPESRACNRFRWRSWCRNLQDECKMQLKNATVLHKSAGKRRKWRTNKQKVAEPGNSQPGSGSTAATMAERRRKESGNGIGNLQTWPQATRKHGQHVGNGNKGNGEGWGEKRKSTARHRYNLLIMQLPFEQRRRHLLQHSATSPATITYPSLTPHPTVMAAV